MKIFHTPTLNGIAAASVLYGEYGIMAMMSDKDFISNLADELPELHENETCYFVGYPLSDVFDKLQKCGEAGCNVVFIDNHDNTKFIQTLKSEDITMLTDKIISFNNTNESELMLAWIYINIPMEYRKEPMVHVYDFEESYSHFSIDGLSWIKIPHGFRLLNDYAMKRGQFSEAKSFNDGLIGFGDTRKEDEDWFKRFSTKQNPLTRSLSPSAKVWDLIQNNNMQFINEIMKIGIEKLIDGGTENEINKSLEPHDIKEEIPQLL